MENIYIVLFSTKQYIFFLSFLGFVRWKIRVEEESLYKAHVTQILENSAQNLLVCRVYALIDVFYIYEYAY